MLLTNAFSSDPRVNKEARSLVEAGYQVTVIAWDKSRAHTRLETRDGIKIERIHAWPTYGHPLKKIVFLPLFWISVIVKLIFRSFHYLHCHDFDTLPCGFFLGKVRGKKIIYDQHDYYSRMIKSNKNIPKIIKKPAINIVDRLEKYFVRHIDKIIVVEEVMASDYPGLGDKLVIVSNFPELNFFPDEITPHDEVRSRRLIYVGIMTGIRGIRQCIEAVALAREKVKEIELMLVGVINDVQLNNDIQKMMREDKYQEVVKLVGQVPYSRVPRYLNSAGIGLLLFQPVDYHLRAPYQNKLFEYAGFGLPIIASDFQVYEDTIRKHKCGILVDPTDPVKIAEAIVYLVEHPAEARAMGKRGIEMVRENYNWSCSEKNLLRLYRSLES